MPLKLIEKPQTRGNRVASEYARLYQEMLKSLEDNGPDEKYRAFTHTARWPLLRLRNAADGIRSHHRRHGTSKAQLTVARCSQNGLSFRWVPPK